VAQIGDYAINRINKRASAGAKADVTPTADHSPSVEQHRPLERATTFFATPKADPGTPEYYGNITGGILAGAVGVGLLYRFMGHGAAAKFETSFRYGLSLTPTLNRLNRTAVELGEHLGVTDLETVELYQRRVAPYTWSQTPIPYWTKSMLSGSSVGGFLSPTPDGEDLVSDRLSKALFTGLAFTTATTVGIGLKQAGRGLFREALGATTAGLAAGEVDSDVKSLFTTGQLDTWNNRIETDLTYGLGGTFGGIMNVAHERLHPTNGVRASLGARTYAGAARLADTTIVPGHPEPGAYDHLSSRPPTAEELVELKDQMNLSHPDRWYERALLEPRLAMDYSGLDEATKKDIIGELQANLRVAKMQRDEPKGQKIVTIYGSASLADDYSLETTRYIAGRFVQEGYIVQTGGGERGQMLAGNRGAYEAGGRSRAVTIKIPYEQFQHPNNYATELYEHRAMGTRNRQLFSNDVAIVRKGGVGSVYELFGEGTYSQIGRKVGGNGERTIDAPIFIEQEEYHHAYEQVKQMVREGTASTSDLRRLIPFRDPEFIFEELKRREAAKLRGPRPNILSRMIGRVSAKPAPIEPAKVEPAQPKAAAPESPQASEPDTVRHD
jgi:predicted Rossmann-fold nucleotide-binding protein